jgi:glycosyltransferase involved in cell wall biosynthesis
MRQNRRVGIVIGQLSFGGAERQTALLARGLAHQSSYAPVVFCLSSQISPFGQGLSQAGVRCLSPARNLASGIPRVSWLLSSLKANGCDLLYGILNVGNIYAGAAARMLGMPLVCSIRSSDAGLPRTVRALASMFCGRADWVVANSESCRQWLRCALGATHSRVDVIPNAVDLPAPDANARERLRGSLGVDDGDLLVGTISRMRQEKRPEFFVRVFLELRQTLGRKIHFAWVGADADGQRAIDALIEAVPAPDRANLHFVPVTPEVSDFLVAFDVFVLTSAFEGMPNALLEAMSLGVPCVATDVEGTRDAVNVPGGSGGKVCILASRNDPTEFAETLARLAENPQEMTSLGERARAHVREHFTVESMVRRHVQVFERVLEHR